MIDPNQPLELDDGTPMEIVGEVRAGGKVYVRAAGNAAWSPFRDDETAFDQQSLYYHIINGRFGGGDTRTFKVLRNRSYDPSESIPEDWS